MKRKRKERRSRCCCADSPFPCAARDRASRGTHGSQHPQGCLGPWGRSHRALRVPGVPLPRSQGLGRGGELDCREGSDETRPPAPSTAWLWFLWKLGCCCTCFWDLNQTPAPSSQFQDPPKSSFNHHQDPLGPDLYTTMRAQQPHCASIPSTQQPGARAFCCFSGSARARDEGVCVLPPAPGWRGAAHGHCSHLARAPWVAEAGQRGWRHQDGTRPCQEGRRGEAAFPDQGLKQGGKHRQQKEIVKLEVQICFLPCVKTFLEDKITSQSGDGPRARWHLLQPGCQAGGSRPGAGRSRSCVQAAGSRCCHTQPHVPGLMRGLPGCPCLQGFGKGPSKRSAAQARGAKGGAARVGLAPKGSTREPGFRGFPACCAMGWEPLPSRSTD